MPTESSAEGPPATKKQKLTSDPSSADPTLPLPPVDTSTAPLPESSTSAPAPTTSHSTGKHVPEHGNYRGYYSKRKTSRLELDPRLAILPPEWFHNARVLDVGCNSGVVTAEVGQRFRPARVTGVDIDDALIGQARKYVELAWSLQSPSPAIKLASRPNTRDLPPHAGPTPRPTPSSIPPIDLHYFPLSLPRMFGVLPTPPRDILTTYEEAPAEVPESASKKGRTRKVPPTEVLAFPDNLRFKAADWPNEDIPSDKRGYNVIIAFSVTKWIHLHTLNAGLLKFFAKCFTTLLPGGRLILEPQPFSTYSKSAKFSDALKVNWETLRGDGEEKGWRDEDGDFERVLLEVVGFERRERMGCPGKDGFRRPVDVYHKRGGSWL